MIVGFGLVTMVALVVGITAYCVGYYEGWQEGQSDS